MCQQRPQDITAISIFYSPCSESPRWEHMLVIIPLCVKGWGMGREQLSSALCYSHIPVFGFAEVFSKIWKQRWTEGSDVSSCWQPNLWEKGHSLLWAAPVTAVSPSHAGPAAFERAECL